MKAFGIFLIAFSLLLLVMVSTKPSDYECTQQIRRLVGGQVTTGAGDGWDQVAGSLAGLLTANEYTIRIEDHFIYKIIYSRMDGRKLGYGMFTTVVIL